MFSELTIDLNWALANFAYVFDCVLAWLKSKVFVIGVVRFDLFTLSISIIALEIIWFFLSWIIRDDLW